MSKKRWFLNFSLKLYLFYDLRTFFVVTLYTIINLLRKKILFLIVVRESIIILRHF